jgi:hypothetical protein
MSDSFKLYGDKMVYLGNKITIEELNILLEEYPEDEELLLLKEDYEHWRKLILNSNVLENNNKKYYNK